MRLNVKALAIALGVIWGGSVFLTGIAHLLWPGYGVAFLEFAASLYPGYHVDGGFPQIIVGTLYGLLDGAAGGAIVAWLYNVTSASSAARS
jgi:hypothetical protein